MSFHLQPHSSIEALLDYVVGVSAALKAKEELATAATPWEELRRDLKQARDERDESRYVRIQASARVRVVDADWDEQVGALSGRAFLAADKQASKPPYAPLFGAVTAADARRL